jgi:hypothetical protein
VTCGCPIAAGDGHDFPRLIDESRCNVLVRTRFKPSVGNVMRKKFSAVAPHDAEKGFVVS